MLQINSEGISHHERHGSSWGEKLLNLMHKIPLIKREDCCENASSYLTEYSSKSRVLWQR